MFRVFAISRRLFRTNCISSRVNLIHNKLANLFLQYDGSCSLFYIAALPRSTIVIFQRYISAVKTVGEEECFEKGESL